MNHPVATTRDLHLALLGRPIFNLGDSSIRDVVPQKILALLCYLALNPGEHEREAVAELLWGGEEKTAQQVLTSFRTDLTRTRKQIKGFLSDNLPVDLSDSGGTTRREYGFLITNRKTVSFNRDSVYWLDVAAFEDYLREQSPNNQREPAMRLDKETVERLKRAVALYRGQFLEGFLLREAPNFEGWMRLQQARLEIMAFTALNRLISYALVNRQYQDGVMYGQQLLSLEPTREESHRELMRLLALSGQRSAALEQFEKCRLILAADELEPGQETVHLAEQIRDDLLRPQPAPSPPVPIQQPAPFQPPPDPTHFVNRETLLLQLRTAIATGSNQRLAVVGMGGMGKTSLAIHLAHQVRDQFADGVLWADVSHDDPIGLIDRWAEAYNCDFRTVADEASRAAALRDILKDKKALLILDDVDHLAKVRPLIPESFPGTVLLTTRDEDVAFHLQAQKFHLEELAEADGLALLRRVVGEERVQAEIAAANQLCVLLQNLPLALNITAQRLALRHQMYLRDMVARLRQEKSRLAALDEQDQAVRASFMVSWRALDDKQKRIFALMGLFAGRSFTADALIAIAKADPYETEDQLFALNALSLVARTADGRYRQHALLAEFARESLTNAQAEQNLAHYYLAYAQEYGQNYDALRPEWENLMAGMETAYRQEMWAEVLGYSEALTEAWFARGRYTEARQGYEWAVAAAEATHDPLKQANALLHRGRACLEQGSYGETRELFQQGLLIYQQINHLEGIAKINSVKARLLLEQVQNDSDLDKAFQLLNVSQIAYRQIGDQVGEAETLTRQARIFYLKRNHEQAKLLIDLAIEKHSQVDNKSGMITALCLASQISQISSLLHENRLNQAYDYLLAALKICQSTGELGETAVVLNLLANVFLKRQDIDRATDILKQSIDIMKRTGTQRNLAMALLSLSKIHLEQKAFHTALEAIEESINLCRRLGDNIMLLPALDQAGTVWSSMGFFQQAHQLWLEAITLAEQLNNIAAKTYIHSKIKT